MSLEKKAKQLVKLTDKQEAQVIRELQKQYSASFKEVRKNIADMYAKYSDDGVLTYAQMQKYNRLVALEKNITAELNALYSDTSRQMKAGLMNTYQDSYLFTGFSLETEAQQKLAFALLPKDQIREAIQNPISGLTLNERLQNNRKNVIIKTREQLTQGLIQGESINKMARRIKDVYEGDLNKSVRIARTETNRVRNQGTLDSYEHAEKRGLEFDKVWVATVDDRVRDSHAELDGQIADKDGLFYVRGLHTLAPGMFGVASEDINCRCTTIVKLKDIESAWERRIKSGQTEQFKTYEQWVDEKKLSVEADAILGKDDKIKFVKANTHKEAEEYAVNELGFKKASTKGLDLELVNANNEALTEMFNRYPDLKGSIDELNFNNRKTIYGVHDVKLNSKGNELISDYSSLSFSKQIMGDVDTYKTVWANDLKNGFHPTNVTNIKAVGIHETTHALEWALTKAKYQGATTNQVVTAINAGEISQEIRRKAFENLNLSQPGKKQYEAVKDLGRYSMKNSKEFLAEAMTDALLSPEPLPISKEILKIVDAMAKG